MRTAPLLILALVGGLALGVSVSVSDPGARDAGAKSPTSPLDDGRRLCQSYSGIPDATSGAADEAGMVWIAGGSFQMGSNKFYPEERSPRQVSVSGFWIARHEITNAQFAAFVAATGYRTVAERGLDPKKYPNIPPELRVPGSMVFFAPKNSRIRMNITEWWRYVPGADWRHPFGPGISMSGRGNHPVVHIAFADAQAYARWRRHSLPTEAEWEFAARGGINGADYAWGDEPTPDGRWMANAWQGFFPFQDSGSDGYHGTAPVGCFPANGYGLFDMIGNVWEWAEDWYRPGHRSVENGAVNPTGPAAATVAGPVGPVRVIKGGSWLCASNFCGRYRPSARQPQEIDLGASHIGFRTILRGKPPPAGK
jgi:formylglycine-generating enzyme required for sulfatase activity